MKILKFTLATLAYILILLGAYFIHVSFFQVNVVFYSSIADGFLALIIAFCGLFFLKCFNLFCLFEKFQLIVIWTLIGYSFAISVPTVLDRSLSFYILEKIQQRGGGIKYDQFNEVIIKEYVKEHRLVDVRLTEQMQSGTLFIKDGCVKLTYRGELLASFSRFFRQNFLAKRRLLMGEYSDDLVDPFRNSIKASNYECK